MDDYKEIIIKQFKKQLPLEDIRTNQLFNDFLKYINYVKDNRPALTQTGNLKLSVIEDLKNYISFPKSYLEYGWKIKSQMDWPYLDYIDVLARFSNILRKYKNKLIITKTGMEFLTWDFVIQYMLLFMVYWNVLDWQYFFPYVDEDNPALKLQNRQLFLLDEIVSLIAVKKEWISFFEFAEYLRSKLNLICINPYGDNLPERVRDSIEDVILKPFQEFGLVEFKYKVEKDGRFEYKHLDSFNFTSLGKTFFQILQPQFKEFIMLFNL